jgi:hypothetical protein
MGSFNPSALGKDDYEAHLLYPTADSRIFRSHNKKVCVQNPHACI